MTSDMFQNYFSYLFNQTNSPYLFFPGLVFLYFKPSTSNTEFYSGFDNFQKKLCFWIAVKLKGFQFLRRSFFFNISKIRIYILRADQPKFLLSFPLYSIGHRLHLSKDILYSFNSFLQFIISQIFNSFISAYPKKNCLKYIL